MDARVAPRAALCPRSLCRHPPPTLQAAHRSPTAARPLLLAHCCVPPLGRSSSSTTWRSCRPSACASGSKCSSAAASTSTPPSRFGTSSFTSATFSGSGDGGLSRTTRRRRCTRASASASQSRCRCRRPTWCRRGAPGLCSRAPSRRRARRCRSVAAHVRPRAQGQRRRASRHPPRRSRCRATGECRSRRRGESCAGRADRTAPRRVDEDTAATHATCGEGDPVPRCGGMKACIAGSNPDLRTR